MKKILVLIVIAGIALLNAKISNAQSFSLSLNPEKHEIISKAGQTIILPYSLLNLGDPQLLKFNVYSREEKDDLENFALMPYKKTANRPEFAVINADMEMGKPFLMNGKSTVLFDVEITIPKKTETKDYYVTFVAESEGMKGAEGTSSLQLEGGVGSNILLTVTNSGAINQSAKIALFDIPSVPSINIHGNKYSFVDSYQPIPYIITIINTGANYFNTTGTIQIGSESALKLPKATILSGEKHEISSKLQNHLISKKLFGLEKITATISVAQSQVLYASANIIILPVNILIILGLLFIISTTIFLLHKKRQ